MKRLLSVLLIVFFTFGLSACDLLGDDTEIPPEIIDCITNPDGEGCPDINPDPECETDEIMVDGVCVLIDGRTVEEIFADAIIANLDGELSHLDLLMATLDLETSMEFIIEFNLEVEEDVDGVTEAHIANAIVTDNFQYLETGTLMHRNITVTVDEETYSADMIFEEVPTGVVVYINIADIKTLLETEDPEILEFLETLGAEEDWLMFRFDDTLANMIELEVMKTMIFDIFFLEMGETFFYDLQVELDGELGLELADYGIDLGLFIDYLDDGLYDDAELMVNDIYDNHLETLIFDLDALHLVPEIVNLLNSYQGALDLAGLVTADLIVYLEANGTEAFLLSLTDDDISTLLDVMVDAEIDDPKAPDFSDMYDAYVLGELDHFIVMYLLDQTDVVYELQNMLNFDFDVYKAGMDPGEFDDIIYEMDREHMVHRVIDLLLWHEWELYQLNFDVWQKVYELEDYGTLYFLDNLSPEEVAALLSVMSWQEFEEDDWHPDIADLLTSYNAGELDRFILEFVLDNVEVDGGIRDLPGLDFDIFYAAMDNLDYDAFYLEEIDPELLATAIYEGQIAYDIYLVALAITAPETASILAAFSEGVAMVEEYMVYVDDINYALDNLFIFETYIDIQYYLDNDMISIAVVKTDDFEIETTVTLDASNYSKLFVDVIADVYWYLDDFETFEMPYVQYLNCPAPMVVGVDCEEFSEYLDIIDNLEQLGYMDMVTVYDPANPGEMVTVIDFTNFANALVAMDEGSLIFNDISIKVTVKEDGLVTIPTTVSSVNDMAEDFARFSVNFMAWDIVRDALEYYEDYQEYYEANPLEVPFGDHPLDTYDDMNVSKAFDANMSFITIGGSILDPTFTLTLFWADGTEVFVTPITLAYLASILDVEGMPSATQYQTMIEAVDGDNWNLSKMIIVFLFSDFDNDDDDYYEEYDEEKEMIFWEAMEVENAGHLYCAQTVCNNGTQLTWAQLEPYMASIDTSNYDLANNGGIIVTIVDGYVTVDLERAGSGLWEFPEGEIPSWHGPEVLNIDID